MLRPERMSKVSVTGSKTVMDDVIEAVHGLNLLHLSDYDGRWEGFSKGDPIEGADEASSKLVTVRSLQSILGVEADDAGPSRILGDEELEEELEAVRAEANELDDRRDEIEDDLRAVEEEINALAPFATLGVDLDLLYGYDSLSVAVGEGDPAAVESTLRALDVPWEVFSEEDVVAAFAATDEDTLENALVEAPFTAVDVPDAEGDPEEYLAQLEEERQTLESKLSTVEEQIEDLRYDAAGFLLAAEEQLSIEVGKAEAPLTFATTENAFVAEGWVPTESVDHLARAVDEAVGEHADVEELEVAAYSRHGHAETTEEVHDDAGAGAGADEGPTATADEGAEGPETAADGAGDGPERATDGGEPDGARRAPSEPRPDGGVVTMDDDDPPVIQDNPDVVKPFEVLTQAVGRPNYSELDPTFVVFLTLPLMFGFMIGDVGYGLVYAGIGYYLYRNHEPGALQSVGIVAIWAGLFTAAFGFVFGEIFGLHLVTTYVWDPLIGGAPLHKGLAPNHSTWALAWFLVIAIFGVLHLNIGYLYEFHENYTLHGLKDAIVESGSWILAMNGFWLFVFSTLASGPKPEFIYHVFDADPIPLGFTGFPPIVGWVGVALIAAGFVLLAVGPTYELVEFHLIMAHPLSYLRIGAELVAEVGLAFTVNLLFWGGYATAGEHGQAWHFALTHLPHVGDMSNGHEVTEILFPGLVHMGPGAAVLGVVVLIVGNLIVLALGVMSVGIQAIRLEYFEFFAKFYDGSGIPYDPFGSERTYTTEE